MAMEDPSAGQDQDPTDLHSLAVDVQTDLQKLAVGLAHAGASPQAVQQLTRMASLVAQVVKVLGEGPPPDQNAAAQQHSAPPPSAAAAPQPQAQPAPPPTAPPEQHSIHAATHALHAAMQASVLARQGQ